MGDLHEVATPALILDLDVLDRNLARMQDLVGAAGIQLRPHAKTHKSVEIARRQLAAGAAGITVGTISEGEVFAAGGIEEIFVAYPLVVTGAKARRLAALHDRVRLSVGVDSLDGASTLAGATAGTSRPLNVLIECDSGEHRSGVPASSAGELAQAVGALGLQVVGAFTHGGHGYGRDAVRADAAKDERNALSIAATEMRNVGIDPLVLSAGSTPTVALSSAAPVTEQRPGTYVFNDRNQVAFGVCDPLDVAVTVLTTVVSDASTVGRVIVDAGGKCLGREPNALVPGLGAIADAPGSIIQDVNDYHGFLVLAEGHRPSIGERLRVVPNHICPVVNLFEEYVVTQAGHVIDVWPVDARAKSQ